MKEHVSFDEILTIPDHVVCPSMRLGIFNEKSEGRTKTQYRLFSVVEHIGKQSTQGHYISYTMDSDDQWIKFDDTKVKPVNLDTILSQSQAYILFYELML